jgi:hypothetical protein
MKPDRYTVHGIGYDLTVVNVERAASKHYSNRGERLPNSRPKAGQTATSTLLQRPLQQMTHESYSRVNTVVRSSDRSFGIMISIALSLVALINYWHDGRWWPWAVGIAALLLAAAFLAPVALKPLNWIWFHVGLLIHMVVNPIVMALLFYVAVVPTGLIMRAMGKDMLRLKREPHSDSYWIVRRPPGPAPETMKDQF